MTGTSSIFMLTRVSLALFSLRVKGTSCWRNYKCADEV